MFVFLILVLIRVGQGFFIDDISYFELKWLLLGEWLADGYRLYGEAYDYTGPLAALVYKYLDLIFGRSQAVHHVVSSLVIIVQAGIFNQLLLKNKAYDENSYLPAFLYMILVVSVPDFMALSPQLMSLTFVLQAFRNVLRRIDNQVTDELFLNTGLFTGLATMIYLPALVFFLVFLVSLILFSTAVSRRLLLYLFGFSLVFSMCVLYFYWVGSLESFWQSFVTQAILMSVDSPLDTTLLFNLFGPLLFIFTISAFRTWSRVRLTSFQQKVQQVIWLMFLGSVCIVFLSNEKVGHEALFFVPVVAYFWTHFFIVMRRKFFRFVMPGLLIFGVVGYSFYSYQNYVEPLLASSDTVVSPGTMILGEQLEAYKEIPMSTPCFNQALSEHAFDQLGYYEFAGRFYQLLIKTNPSVIVDELGVMETMKYRFPLLESNYQPVGEGTFQQISN